jgi:hypothetical protein
MRFDEKRSNRRVRVKRIGAQQKFALLPSQHIRSQQRTRGIATIEQFCVAHFEISVTTFSSR